MIKRFNLVTKQVLSIIKLWISLKKVAVFCIYCYDMEPVKKANTQGPRPIKSVD